MLYMCVYLCFIVGLGLYVLFLMCCLVSLIVFCYSVFCLMMFSLFPCPPAGGAGEWRAVTFFYILK